MRGTLDAERHQFWRSMTHHRAADLRHRLWLCGEFRGDQSSK
jgi:hypothetical protein